MIKMEDFDRLYAIVDYQSGDSWNGTHERWIKVDFPDDYSIRVSSVSSMGGDRTGVFGAEDVINCYEKLSGARHYQEFMAAWDAAERNSAERKAQLSAPTQQAKLEKLLSEGTSQPTPAFKKLVCVKKGLS